MAKIRIILVDDHLLVRASLKSLMAQCDRFEVVAETGDGREAIDLAKRFRPDVMLMDIAMPKLNGIETIRRICKELPKARILVLSMYSHEPHVYQAMQAGASGYILKSSPSDELVAAIESVARGQTFLSPSISQQVIDACLSGTAWRHHPIEQLTPRQRETLQLIAEGHPTKQIALTLGATVKTIETHRTNLMERLNIHNVAGLVRFAMRHGIVSSQG